MLTYYMASEVTSFTLLHYYYISTLYNLSSFTLIHLNTICSVVFILLWRCTYNCLQWWNFWFQVIVSRMRYISSQTERSIRFVGLSTALANARYVSKGYFGFHFSLSAITSEYPYLLCNFIELSVCFMSSSRVWTAAMDSIWPVAPLVVGSPDQWIQLSVHIF